MNKPRYLIACDFDETLFHTFRPSPNGIDVRKAYKLALDNIFGSGLGEWFFKVFGLDGRTPSEVINEIVNWDKDFVARAYRFYESPEGRSGYLIPECPNGELNWNQESPAVTITQMLVGQKLKYLINEIGQRDSEGNPWPQPCEGVLDFYETVHQLRSEGVPLDTAIISSGHEGFIKKTFDLWGIKHPDVIVTEDDIRPKKFPSELERRFKPGQLPIALAHYKWLKYNGPTQGDENIVFQGRESKQRIMYVGDDPYRDGAMAFRGGIPHVYLYPFTPWEAIADTLVAKKHFFDGRPLADILRKESDKRETDILLPDNLELKYHFPGKERG